MPEELAQRVRRVVDVRHAARARSTFAASSSVPTTVVEALLPVAGRVAAGWRRVVPAGWRIPGCGTSGRWTAAGCRSARRMAPSIVRAGERVRSASLRERTATENRADLRRRAERAACRRELRRSAVGSRLSAYCLQGRSPRPRAAPNAREARRSTGPRVRSGHAPRSARAAEHAAAQRREAAPHRAVDHGIAEAHDDAAEDVGFTVTWGRPSCRACARAARRASSPPPRRAAARR